METEYSDKYYIRDKTLYINSIDVKELIIPDGIEIIARDLSIPRKKLSIEKVYIPNTVKFILEKAFMDADNLLEIIIPDSVIEIEKSAFEGCIKLKKVVLSKNLKEIKEKSFSHCGFESITIPNSVTNIEFGAFTNCNNLIECVIPNSVKKIGDYSFHNCINLNKLILSNRLRTLNSYIIGNCHKINELIIPKSVIKIERTAIFNCKNLKYIHIKNKNCKHAKSRSFFELMLPIMLCRHNDMFDYLYKTFGDESYKLFDYFLKNNTSPEIQNELLFDSKFKFPKEIIDLLIIDDNDYNGYFEGNKFGI